MHDHPLPPGDKLLKGDDGISESYHLVCPVHKMHEFDALHATSLGSIALHFPVEAEDGPDSILGKNVLTVRREEVRDGDVLGDPCYLVGIHRRTPWLVVILANSLLWPFNRSFPKGRTRQGQ